MYVFISEEFTPEVYNVCLTVSISRRGDGDVLVENYRQRDLRQQLDAPVLNTEIHQVTCEDKLSGVTATRRSSVP